jgi:hypothetical protein
MKGNNTYDNQDEMPHQYGWDEIINNYELRMNNL